MIEREGILGFSYGQVASHPMVVLEIMDLFT